jgi:hypothetical protein
MAAKAPASQGKNFTPTSLSRCGFDEEEAPKHRYLRANVCSMIRYVSITRSFCLLGQTCFAVLCRIDFFQGAIQARVFGPVVRRPSRKKRGSPPLRSRYLSSAAQTKMSISSLVMPAVCKPASTPFLWIPAQKVSKRCILFCHPREGGGPEPLSNLDSRLRGNDEVAKLRPFSTRSKRQP